MIDVLSFFVCIFVILAILTIGEKMSKYNKKIVFIACLLIGIVVLFLYLFFFYKQPSKPEINHPEEGSIIPEKNSYLNSLSGKELDENIKKVIIEYMDVYYEIMQKLEVKDMTYLFDDSNSEQALINQAAISLLVDIRKMKQIDLRLDQATYDLVIESIEQKENTVKVVLKENSFLRFHFMKDIESKVYNITNEFTLLNKNGQYKILEYTKEQDFFVMITDKYSKGGKTSLDKITNDYVNLIRTNIEKDKQSYYDFINEIDMNSKTCDHPYNREAALNYAKEWVNKRNKEWSTFDANCQNYASQVLYSGGIPMDYMGSAVSHLQWKFYNPNYNEREIASGYLYTWTYVPYFYTYAKNNTGLGLCADVDVNMYYAEAGDIIHLGTNVTETGPNRHAVVVVGTYKEDNMMDILVNSNTIDLENYPLSAYVYPYSSLIKIYGYND